MSNEYCVGVVAVKNASISPSSCTITHDKVKYELLIKLNVARLTSGIFCIVGHYALSNCSQNSILL